jgi:hypothetical protein
MTTMNDVPILTDPWWDLRHGGQPEDKARQACHAELLIEVSAGHPLPNGL